MNKHLENIAKDGLNALRDAIVVGGIAYLICEAGENALDESILKAKVIGTVVGLADYGARLFERYLPDAYFDHLAKP
ncbi:hypothetical protein HYS72_00510 [Candidatus Pacearchaeota archaeon]|nr:hypothetical protein [Candidatus Pacearchaeota archaeon]MBI2057183.1 hypothetical protein [Candidatus Pacearchaeota archaeon]